MTSACRRKNLGASLNLLVVVDFATKIKKAISIDTKSAFKQALGNF